MYALKVGIRGHLNLVGKIQDLLVPGEQSRGMRMVRRSRLCEPLGRGILCTGVSGRTHSVRARLGTVPSTSHARQSVSLAPRLEGR